MERIDLLLGVAIALVVIGIGLLGVALSRRRFRELDAAAASLTHGVDAPGIDEDFAEEVAPGDDGWMNGPDTPEGGMK
jgi:hypothetical protein